MMYMSGSVSRRLAVGARLRTMEGDEVQARLEGRPTRGGAAPQPPKDGEPRTEHGVLVPLALDDSMRVVGGWVIEADSGAVVWLIAQTRRAAQPVKGKNGPTGHCGGVRESECALSTTSRRGSAGRRVLEVGRGARGC